MTSESNYERALILLNKLSERFENVDWEVWADLQEIRACVLDAEQNERAQGFIDAINRNRNR